MRNFRNWQKCRDMIEGEDAIKRNATSYLPRPAGKDEGAWAAYVNRTDVFNATGRTHDGFHGLMFRVDPEITIDMGYEQYLNNVDGKGTSFKKFISDKVSDSLVTGWNGVLVDAPENAGNKSVKEAEEQNLYPFMTLYHAEDIHIWRYDTVARSQVKVMIVLQEWQDDVSSDGFTVDRKDRKRVLDLVDLNGNGHKTYRQRVFLEGSLEKEFFPERFGRQMDFIPFYFGPSNEPEKPLLMDLVNENLAWIRNSADYENGMYYTSVPTPFTRGFTPEKIIKTDEKGNQREENPVPVTLGPDKFIHFPDTCTEAGMLEFSGAGLASIREAMDDKKESMAILGARLISAEKKGVESAETAEIHRGGENSVLAAFANRESKCASDYGTCYIQWCANNPDIELTAAINTDYIVSAMDSGRLTALMQLWQQGAIGKRVLFYNLKQGEVIPKELTFEAMEAEQSEETPPAGLNANTGSETT